MSRNNFVIVTLVSVLIIAIVTFYNRHQERLALCQGYCDYLISSKSWGYHGYAPGGGMKSLGRDGEYTKYFQSQKQCTDYCLIK